MRCPKCGFHSAIPTSVLTSSPPINVYRCCVEDCKHEWKVQERRASRVVDPDILSLEERVELLERLVFFLMGVANKSNLPSGQDLDVICFGNLLTGQYSRECIDKAKEKSNER